MASPTASRRPAHPAVIITLQSLAGAGLGAACAYLGATIGWRYFAGDPAGFGDIVARIAGIILGYPIGVAAGIWLVGRLMGRPAPLWAAGLGAAAGAGLIVLISPLLNGMLVFGWGLLFVASLAGGIAGHHLAGRRAKRGGSAPEALAPPR